MMEEFEFYEEDVEYVQQESDEYFQQAQQDIKALYESDKDKVYYLRQLQLKFEKKYFHWVTNNALEGLIKIGYLNDFRFEQTGGTSTRYFIHHTNRYPKRDIKKIEDVIREYSQDHITRGCGYRAEELFCNSFALRGFMPIAKKVKKYKEKVWRTEHDLDYVFRKDNIEYGCEIKNTLGYIDKEELDIKLEMCRFFDIKPLFIMRYAPKTYNKKIYENGGFALIFETQIYELGQVELVNKIKGVIGLPVICSKGIPEGIIDRFDNWHKKQVK
jgi:hypothetical protein